MLGAREANHHQDAQRAGGEDFCGIFEKNMTHFYLLSFLLTADRRMAEECFVRGLEDSARSNRVFKEWADSWARRTIIHNAIQMVRPAPTDTSTSSSGRDGIAVACRDRASGDERCRRACCLRPVCVCDVSARALLRSGVCAAAGLHSRRGDGSPRPRLAANWKTSHATQGGGY